MYKSKTMIEENTWEFFQSLGREKVHAPEILICLSIDLKDKEWLFITNREPEGMCTVNFRQREIWIWMCAYSHPGHTAQTCFSNNVFKDLH